MTPKQWAVAVGVVLAIGVVLVVVERQHSSEPSVVGQMEPQPLTNPPVVVSTPAVQQQTPAPPPSAVAPASPVSTSATADYSEHAVAVESDHHDDSDEVVQKPSQTVINAVQEIKKPTPDEGKVTVNPDGSEKVTLGNRFMSVPVATAGKDGKVHVDYHGERYVPDNEEKNHKN